jgi:hypothetical protein
MAAGTLNAQNVNIGTKIGLNAHTISTDNSSEFDSRIGIHVGLLGHIHLNRKYAFQPELVYSTQGAKSGDTNLRLDYINVPFMVQYMFDNGFRLQAGPQLGFLVNAKAENNNNSIDVKDEFKTVDLSLGFGASYVHNPTGFGIDARYNFGLNDISESSNVNSTNRVLQIGVFYLFGHIN